MRRRTAYIGEGALWLAVLLLALLWGLLVTPGTGRRVPATEADDLLCTEWRTIEQLRHPDGLKLGEMAYCVEYGR